MKYYLLGTTFSLIDNHDTSNDPQLEKYILAQCHKEGYVFQIICITGYHAGYIYCYVKEDSQAKTDNVIGVSEEHLINQIRRGFDFPEDSLKIDKTNLYTKDKKH